MNKGYKYQKFDIKSKNTSNKNYKRDEEQVSLKELKRDKEHKQFRNFDNALRSRDLSALLGYEDD